MNTDKMQAGQELDALIAKRVMRWQPLENSPVGWWITESGQHLTTNGKSPAWGDSSCFAPSTDIVAAWQVVDRLTDENKPFPRFCIWWGNQLSWMAEFQMTEKVNRSVTYARTPELAICRAALEAVMKC